jgi:hypothetical protein
LFISDLSFSDIPQPWDEAPERKYFVHPPKNIEEHLRKKSRKAKLE